MNNIKNLYKGKSESSIVNIIRNKYDNMEIAYLSETKNVEKLCLYCNKKSEFISIFKGYKNICSSDGCKKKYFIDRNLDARKKISELNKVFLTCSACEKNKVFVQNTTKNKNKSCICDSIFCKKNKDRPFLLEKHIISDFNYGDLSYMNNLIYLLMSEYENRNKVKRILYKNLLIAGIEDFSKYLKHQTITGLLCKNFDPKNFEKTKDELYFIDQNSRYKEDILKSIYKENLENYIKKYYPEKFKKCSICKKEYRISNVFSVMKKKSDYTCSIECYRKNFKFYMTEDRKKKQSKSIKNKIENGLFTPNVFNSITRKNIELKNENFSIKFRSSWELLFYVMNPGYKYEELRIPYLYNSNQKIYLVDFICKESRKVVEIKPSSKNNDPKNKAKIESLNKWCKLNNYKMSLVGENDLKKYKYSEFVKEINKNNYKIGEEILKKIYKLIN